MDLLGLSDMGPCHTIVDRSHLSTLRVEVDTVLEGPVHIDTRQLLVLLVNGIGESQIIILKLRRLIVACFNRNVCHHGIRRPSDDTIR